MGVAGASIGPPSRGCFLRVRGRCCFVQVIRVFLGHEAGVVRVSLFIYFWVSVVL